MISDPLANVSDATIRLCALWWLIGYGMAWLMAVVIFWRRLTHPPDQALRMLRMAVDDAQGRAEVLQGRADQLATMVSERQRTIDAQTQQICALYDDVNRMARLYVERAATVNQAPATGTEPVSTTPELRRPA